MALAFKATCLQADLDLLKELVTLHKMILFRNGNPQLWIWAGPVLVDSLQSFEHIRKIFLP